MDKLDTPHPQTPPSPLEHGLKVLKQLYGTLFGKAHGDLHERLFNLGASNRKNAAQAALLINFTIALILGCCLLLIIGLLSHAPLNDPESISLFTHGIFGTNDDNQVSGALLANLSLLASVTLIAFSINMLIQTSRVFAESYQRSMKLFQKEGAPFIAYNEYVNHLRNKLISVAIFKIKIHDTPLSIEEHLDYCACHLQSLRNITKGDKRLSIWQLRLEENIFRHRKWFIQARYLICLCGGALIGWLLYELTLTTLFGILIFSLLLMYLTLGHRYIASRGALVALCDFMLMEGGDEDKQSPPLKT